MLRCGRQRWQWRRWHCDRGVLTVNYFARVEDGQVAEIFATDQDIKKLFHPGILWLPADGVTGLRVGWAWDGGHFTPPVPTPGSSAPTQQGLGMQIAALQQQLNGLVAEARALGVSVPSGGAVPPTASSVVGGGAN